MPAFVQLNMQTVSFPNLLSLYLINQIYKPLKSNFMSEPILPPTDVIPLSEAETLTQNWRTFIAPQAIVPSSFIHAFYIPMDDITQLAAFHTEAIAVRAYVCMENTTDPMTAKIVLVPVSEKNTDILSTYIPGTDGTSVEVSTIYDFTQPCPQACDFESPLYE